jgi:hypothetical protein
MKKLLKVGPKPQKEKSILYVAGMDKDLVDWLRIEYKVLGYSWLNEYLNAVFKQLKDQSEGGSAAGSKVRKSG